MGHTWQNGSHLETWITIGKMGHTFKKWVTLKKNWSHLKIWVIICKMGDKWQN